MKKTKKYEFIVSSEDEGKRLDVYLCDMLGEEASRSLVQKWIKNGYVCGSVPVKSSLQVETGNEFTIEIPQTVPHSVEPVDLQLQILHEDKDLAVIVKPPGIAVHPGPGEKQVTLINGLHYLWKNLPGDEQRPGIVHRLDAPTEGIMLIAKNEKAHRILAEDFQNRNIKKQYSAWLGAAPSLPEGRIELAIKRHPHERMKMRIDATGRMAVTLYKIEKCIVSKKGRKFAFADIEILTGRTHQIRVHMAHIGCPVVGDSLYSRTHAQFSRFGLLLFARKLEFLHPVSKIEMKFELTLPDRFLEFEKKCQAF